LHGARTELQETDDGHCEGKCAKVVTCFEHSARLPTECPECRESEQDRYEKCGVAEGAIETGSPPGDETTFISAAADDIGTHEGEENKQYAQKLPAKTWCAGKLRE
jgi:hypothetical protein